MKFKYLIAIVAIFVVALSGCKKDDIETRPTSEIIVGTWAIHTLEGRVMNGNTLERVISINNLVGNGLLVFGGNNAFLYDRSGLQQGLDAGTYTVTNKAIATVSAPNSFNFEVLTADKTILTLKEVRINYPGFPGRVVEIYYTCLPQ